MPALGNTVIAKLFRLAHLSENLGYGLRKLKHWQEITGRPVHIDTSINSVKVTFYLKNCELEKNDVGVNVGVKLTETQSKILDLIKNNPAITHSELAQALSVTIKTAERTTKSLREHKLIERTGSDKTGYWVIQPNDLNKGS